MFNPFKKFETTVFVVGAVAGAVGLQVLKSKKVRDFAVSTIAKGISVKDAFSEEVANLKEEAADMCAEAKKKAQDDADYFWDEEFEDEFEDEEDEII